MTISEALAEFASDNAPLPADVVDQAKLVILDAVGVTYAGSGLRGPRIVAEHVTANGGRAEARVLVTQTRVPAAQAAFANGVAAHALDMDDGHRHAAAHPAVAVFPAALAAAERAHASGGALLRAVAVGYEVFIRIASAINPAHLKRGFHTTSTVGPFGAAAAAATLMGLDRTAIANAFGLAGLSGAGLLEVLRTGAMAKPYQTGRGSAAGLLAADLAAAGFDAPRAIFEGETGFFAAVAGTVDQPRIIAGLGSDWAIRGVYFKGHAACRHTHPAIDAALQLRGEGITADSVRAIRVRTYAVAFAMCGTSAVPAGEAEAKFSIPFTVALALVKGHASQAGFTQASLQDPGIRALMQRVTVVVDPEIDAAYPGRRGATLEIEHANGATKIANVPLARGEPETPFGRDELLAKFEGNVTAVAPIAHARDLAARILSLEDARAIDLFELDARTAAASAR